MSLHPVLQEKLNAALMPLAPVRMTPRDVCLPDVAGKVFAVIGMRRAGKTTFLQQLLAQQRQQLEPQRALYLSFDDDRLAGLGAEQLALLLEEFYRRYPELRGRETVHWFLDEIQLIPGWERFVRRVMDSEKVQVVVSGSSARMLSREVHTSLRGRGMEVIIRPYSFREFLRHRGEEPQSEPARWASSTRSKIEMRFGQYLREGGFPEVQGLSPTLRIDLLQGYVDTVLFRDVVERYGVSQVAALRWLIRQCLRNPASALSVHRLHLDLKAQGLGIAKDAVHALFGYLQDAFLINAVPLATESERQRNTNPRKVYPVDTGLIAAFDASGRANVGHALESVVHDELARRKLNIGYGRTTGGFEVDFVARSADAATQLIQVCADISEPAVLAHELRALDDAALACPDAIRRLLLLEPLQQMLPQATGVQIQPVYEWLLTPGTRP